MSENDDVTSQAQTLVTGIDELYSYRYRQPVTRSTSRSAMAEGPRKLGNFKGWVTLKGYISHQCVCTFT